MKAINYLLLIPIALSLLSCQPDNHDGELKIKIAPQTAYALPVPINSCKQGATNNPSIAAPSYELTVFKYSWFGANEFHISYIQITLRSGFLSGGEDKSCIIAGDDLKATLGASSNDPKMIIPGNDTTERVASCAIRCGGLKIQAGTRSAYLPGTIKVVGIQIDQDGNSSPVSGEADIAIQYDAP